MNLRNENMLKKEVGKTMNKTILIVDDEKEIRELLRLYIEKDNYSVIQAENGLEALKQTKLHQIDLVIIDIMMPELDGYQFIKALRAYSNVPIIIVSAKTENHEKILGLDLGADDYIIKPFDPLEVIARIRAQLRRSGATSTDSDIALLKSGSLYLNTSSCTLSFNNEKIPLTATEFNIMRLFMESPDHVFTKQQIYEAVWQETAVVDDNTIMVAISKLRGKLPMNSGVSIETVRGLGYRLESNL